MKTQRGRIGVVGTGGESRNHPARWVEMLGAVACIAVLASGLCLADLPALRAPLPTTPATLSQFQAHLPGSSTTGPATNDADIQELARGLRYDPNLMYKFVHDHIHFTPMWGEVKGPYMTWMDRSGNAFDQASLMIALLTNANGHTISNLKYQVGEITVTGAQFTKWFDISNSPNAARMILARGGLYGEVTENGSGGIASVALVHVWVKATIDSNDYEFDPSFKSHTHYDWSGWADTLQYNRTTFVSDAQRAGGGYNKTNIRSHLTTYTNNLADDIRTNHPNDDIREILGGASIDPADESTTLPSLPYTVNYRRQDFAIGSIPNIYRTTLRIQHEGIDQTLYSSDIYGRRLSLKYNGSNQPQLILEGTVKATGTATTPGQAYDLTLTVDHPYETTDFDCTATLKVKAGGFYHVANGWGETGTKILLKHRGLLEKYRLDGYGDSSEQVRGESYTLVGLTYLAKASRTRYLSGLVSNFTMVNHHVVGVTGEYDAPYLDLALGHLGATHRGGNDDATNTAAAFNALAGHIGAYEQEVIRQIQDCNAVSTPRLLEIANDRGTYNRILTATGSGEWSDIQDDLTGWSTEEKNLVTPYITAGFTVAVPEYGDLTQTGWDWTGMGFRANLTTSSMLTAAYIVGNYKGATGCDIGTGVNLAASKSVTASSTYTGFPASNVTDGDLGTRWSSQFSDNQWIYVDLGSTYTIRRIVLRWEASYGRGYKLQVSDNASTWSDVYTTTTGDGGIDEIVLGSAASGRYVRMLGTQRATSYGYSLWEFEVYSGAEGSGPATVLANGFGAVSEGDPEGAYGCGSTDIAIGHGGFPFGLSFGRQYSSHRRNKDGPLGLGWTHNYDISAKVVSDSFLALGTESAINAAGHIVSLYVTKDILASSDSNRTIANLCETWLMDQTKDNVVEIKQGTGLMRFTKKSDGTYNPPPGQALKLMQVSGNWRLKNSKGIFYDFDGSGKLSQWSDAHGNVVSFTYSSGLLTGVAGKIGGTTTARTLTLNYTDGRITSVSDSAGRSISYFYTGNGELWKYRNPDYVQGQYMPEVKYEYDASSKGLLKKIYSPIDQTNPFLTIGYDSLGRMVQQTDANNCVWDFYRATYRNEILPPAQVDTNGVSGRFGSSTWANPDTRKVTNKDAMGRQSTTTYNAQAQPESGVGPAGTSAEFQYDENHNLIEAAALCIPGSSHDDPNIYLQYGYHTHENTEGRWFVHQKQQADAAGNLTYFYYDYNDVQTYGTRLGRLMKVVSPSAGGAGDANRPTVQYTYNSYGQPQTQTDPNGMVTKFEYYTAAEGGGLKKTIVDYGTGHLNLTAELTYDSVGRVATAKDPRNNTTTNEYYPSGRLNKTTPPSPFNGSDYQTTNTYDLAGRLTFVKQGTVVLQAITYNNRGQKATTRGPYPQSYTDEQYAINYTQYAYDALGRLWKVTDAEGKVTKTRYWPDGKVWKVIDAKGNNSVVNRYYGDGSLKEVEDARGKITTYEYNGFKGLARTTYEDDTYEEPAYDSYRRVHEAQGRSGQVIELLYDCLNRVSTKRVWDPNSALVNTITYQYDLMGRLYKVTDNTGTTKNTYDKAGRLIRVEYPGSKTVSYLYDACGNRTRLTYPDNTYITYEYDQLNRMTAVKNSAGTALASYAYDTRSRRTRLDYVNGAYAKYDYDAASRLEDVNNMTGNGQHKYAYMYDKVGNRTSMMVTDSGGTRTHVYTYDNIYQITEVNYPSGFDYLATDTEFNYDAAGNRTSVIDGSGTCTYTTNSLNQYTAAGSTSYQYDDSGNMVYDGTYCYGYDPENRLVLVRKSGPYGTLTLGEALDSPLTYTTGGSGNWTAINGGEGHEDLNSASAPSLAVGQESWLQTTVEGAGTFSFWAKIDPNDANNELKFYVDDTLRYSCESAEWDQFSWAVTGAGTHTLKWVYRRNSQSTAGEGYVDDVGWTGTLPALPPPEPAATNWRYLTYTYDASGRRIEKKYDYETITKYIYDGDHCIAEYNAYNQLKRKYIYGPGVDQPICLIDTMTSPAVTSYYHFDGLGSVVTLTNASGNTVEVYEYDVYGRVGATDAGHPNRILFTGREYDKETGLYYYRARYYNPQIGRFLQTDPVGYGYGMNLYDYCDNDPVNYSDPLGLFKIAFYDGSNPSQAEKVVAEFGNAAFDIQARIGGCPDDLSDSAYILWLTNELVKMGVPIDEIFFFGDSGYTPKGANDDGTIAEVEWLGFGDDHLYVNGGMLQVFFDSLGRILSPLKKGNTKIWKDDSGNNVVVQGPIINLRQSNAALNKTSGTSFWLETYSKWADLSFTAVNGAVEFTPDYHFSKNLAGTDGAMYISALFVSPYNPGGTPRWMGTGTWCGTIRMDQAQYQASEAPEEPN